jgi:uncharacterized protein
MLSTAQIQIDDPVIKKFSADIRALYGDSLERVVLYGSRARGDARPDSDYDIAVFLKDLRSRWKEGIRIAKIQLAILDDTGETVNAMSFPAGSWNDQTSPLMYEIRKDGLDI